MHCTTWLCRQTHSIPSCSSTTAKSAGYMQVQWLGFAGMHGSTETFCSHQMPLLCLQSSRQLGNSNLGSQRRTRLQISWNHNTIDIINIDFVDYNKFIFISRCNVIQVAISEAVEHVYLGGVVCLELMPAPHLSYWSCCMMCRVTCSSTLLQVIYIVSVLSLSLTTLLAGGPLLTINTTSKTRFCSDYTGVSLPVTWLTS